MLASKERNKSKYNPTVPPHQR